MLLVCSWAVSTEHQKGNPMIGCIKKVTVIPGKEKEFERLFNELKAEMAIAEPGNLYYDLYASNDGSGNYVVMERYRDKAALTLHEQSAHGARFFPQLRALIAHLHRDCFESIE
jgi:quinol monooxygenase YgiN